MTILNRKVFRELARMRGQVIAITLVMACGIMVYVSSRHTYIALLESQESYYTSYRFADVFAGIKRAPAQVAERIARIPGVSSVRTRIVMDVNLDVPGLDEPATGRLVSIPEIRRPVLNDLAIQEGRYPAVGRPEEVIISEAFALANGLAPDAWIGAVINGRRKALRVVGIGLSPEYVYEVQGSGSIFPDNLRFGVIWMSRDALGAAFDMEGGFNDLSVALSPDARERDVIDRMDLILEPYGSAGAYGRDSQISHKFLSDEILGLSVSSNVTPAIFLGIAAILLHIVFSRMVRAQRDQIAIMKGLRLPQPVHWMALSEIRLPGRIRRDPPRHRGRVLDRPAAHRHVPGLLPFPRPGLRAARRRHHPVRGDQCFGRVAGHPARPARGHGPASRGSDAAGVSASLQTAGDGTHGRAPDAFAGLADDLPQHGTEAGPNDAFRLRHRHVGGDPGHGTFYLRLHRIHDRLPVPHGTAR